MTNIRIAHSKDAAALADLAERTFRDTFGADNSPTDMELHCRNSFGPEIQRSEIENPDYVTILAEIGRELVAFAQVRLYAPKESVPAERPSELHRLYVSSQWHGRGIAHEVMREVLATVAQGESDWIWLGVWERNSRALAFYRKYGFEVVGDHVFRFGSDPQRDLVMALKVNRLLYKGKSHMQLRPAKYSDVKAIAALHTESWRNNYSNDLSRQYLETSAPGDRLALWNQRLASPKPNQGVVVAETGDRIAGFACVFADENPRWGSYLDNLHVLQDCQAQGIGSALLEEVFRWCGANARSEGLCLLVNQSNLKAQKFYIKKGARNQEPGVWNAPDGSSVPTFWFVWSSING